MVTSGIFLAVLAQAIAAEAVPAVAEHARLRSASVADSDYPRASRKRSEEGRVVFHYRVDESGRPRDCTVRESSGSALLDETSCNIVLRRFRFAPARDSVGNEVPELWEQTIEWELPQSIRLSDPKPVDAR